MKATVGVMLDGDASWLTRPPDTASDSRQLARAPQSVLTMSRQTSHYSVVLPDCHRSWSTVRARDCCGGRTRRERRRVAARSAEARTLSESQSEGETARGGRSVGMRVWTEPSRQTQALR